MRTYDLTPFYRSTVGFDRFFSLLDQAASDGSPGYPPYNIERTGENAYRISVAVSGFSQGELSIVAKENTLTIKGEKSANENGKDKSEVLYRGIAARAFERAFQLADFVQVKNASLENGLLHVDLVREIPEAKKPRSIPIDDRRRPRRWSTARPRRSPPNGGFRRYWLKRKRPGKPGRFFVVLWRFRDMPPGAPGMMANVVLDVPLLQPLHLRHFLGRLDLRRCGFGLDGRGARGCGQLAGRRRFGLTAAIAAPARERAWPPAALPRRARRRGFGIGTWRRAARDMRDRMPAAAARP
jgi:molecular chaperone IbpA